MDAKISTSSPDVVTVTSEPRPTATPVRTSFSEVMARGAGSVVGGAESAMVSLPGTSIMALAVRGGAAGATVAPMPAGGVGGGVGASPMVGLGAAAAEGPGGGGATVGLGGQFLSSLNAAAAGDGGAAASLQQGAQSNLYYLQLQQQINQQSQSFEAMSNVMKTESDTVKNAIGNMH